MTDHRSAHDTVHPENAQKQSRETAYRPDIDGLRAVAVLSVILYHLGDDLLPGGFIGVDVFFVISGFLITRNIMNELRAGHFSLADFYRRRIKRIAPAMFVVVAVTVLLAQQILLPEAAERTAESGLWSVASLANVYFWWHLDTSYFAEPAQLIPLLHLWSLGVEEQFYLLWPLMLMVTYATKRFAIGASLLSLLTIVAAHLLFAISPAFVFYMLPTRAGELLTGAVVASMVVRRRTDAMSGRVLVACGLLGAALIAASLALLNETLPFPGVLAIPPVLGSALLILAGQRPNAIARALSVRPLVWIGLVSYSAYLWHWPLQAFYRYGHGTIGLRAGLAILVLTFVLAWLSYRFVEQPARRSRAGWLPVLTRQYVLPAAAGGAACLVLMRLDGYGVRRFGEYGAELAAVRAQHRPNYEYEYVCQKQRLTPQDAGDPRCIVGASTATSTTAVLWGDSHASHYVGMLSAFAEAGGWRFRNLQIATCPPVDGDPAPFVFAQRLADCRASLDIVRAVVERSQVVIVSASYTLYEAFSPDFWPRFFATVERLADSRVVILLGKVPEIAGYDALCREKALSYPTLHCENTRAPLADQYVAVNGRLRAFADATPNVEFYEATSEICPDGMCSSLGTDGVSIYLDSSHLTIPASRELGERIVRQGGVPPVFAGLAATAP
jgi:peptidoglycan/LPS O-acetylase OafA/YrhL